MKQFAKQWRHTISLLAIVMLSVAVTMIGFELGKPLPTAMAAGFLVLGLWQLSQFALSKRSGVCFNTVLTPEQVKEFGEILDSIKEYSTIFPSLKGLDFEQLKSLPKGFKTIEDITTKLQTDLEKLRRQQLSEKQHSTLIKRANGQHELSVECARHIGGLVLATGLRGGQFGGTKAEHAENMLKSIFSDAEFKTALTSSDIPLPVGYSGQVAELVGLYGVARQLTTVFPLGDGVVKLPKLSTDPTFGLIAGSGTVTEKSPQTAWVTFTAEKFGGLVRMPTEIDEDSIVAMGQFLARYAARQMAYIEDYQVFRSTGAGSGVNGTAEGLTKNVVTDSKTVTQTGLGSPSEMTLAHLRALRAKPDAAALRMGAYYMHPTFEQHLAGLNTAGDKPYNANGLNGATLDGFPIRWVDVMPVWTSSDAVSTVHVLFGDISYQYLAIRGGMRFDTSKEAGFTTDEILVRALERLTTGKMATGAMAGLITAAS